MPSFDLSQIHVSVSVLKDGQDAHAGEAVEGVIEIQHEGWREQGRPDWVLATVPFRVNPDTDEATITTPSGETITVPGVDPSYDDGALTLKDPVEINGQTYSVTDGNVSLA